MCDNMLLAMYHGEQKKADVFVNDMKIHYMAYFWICHCVDEVDAGEVLHHV